MESRIPTELVSSTCSMNMNKDQELHRVLEQMHPCYWMELWIIYAWNEDWMAGEGI